MTAVKKLDCSAISKVSGAGLLIIGDLTISGNYSHLVKPRVVKDNRIELYGYTFSQGMSCTLPAYNMDKNVHEGPDRVVINSEKMLSLKKLSQIASLEDGWNGGNAKAFDGELISKVREIITSLEIQPEIFPTACDLIQAEYEKADGSYLEIAMDLEDVWRVFEVNKAGEEAYSSVAATAEAISKVVSSFYG